MSPVSPVSPVMFPLNSPTLQIGSSYLGRYDGECPGALEALAMAALEAAGGGFAGAFWSSVELGLRGFEKHGDGCAKDSTGCCKGGRHRLRWRNIF